VSMYLYIDTQTLVQYSLGGPYGLLLA